MEYRLEIEGAPESVPGGTGILLLHHSTADTDLVDIQFLDADTDRFLVVSTRTTAEEVDEKLDFYGVDRDAATIIDSISVERGYSRRQSDRVEYLTGPDDLAGLLSAVEAFFEAHEGKLRMSVDSVTELAYYATEALALETVVALLELLEEHDAVGLFHLATEVLDPAFVEAVTDHFDVVLELGDLD